MNIVVYTAVTSGFDAIMPAPPLWATEAKFVAFLEKEQAVEGWEVRPLSSDLEDPCRRAKAPKILVHKYLQDADYSIWIDGCISITSLTPVSEFLKVCLTNHDIAAFAHRKRTCAYDEAEACIASAKDDPSIIRKQMDKYREEGFPDNASLAECCVLVRKHTPACEIFNTAWYEQVNKYSRRDQLSFNYIVHKLGIEYARIPGLISCNEHFRRHRHLESTPPMHHVITDVRA